MRPRYINFLKVILVLIVQYRPNNSVVLDGESYSLSRQTNTFHSSLSLGSIVSAIHSMNIGWGDFLIKAAEEWCNVPLFVLATLPDALKVNLQPFKCLRDAVLGRLNYGRLTLKTILVILINALVILTYSGRPSDLKPCKQGATLFAYERFIGYSTTIFRYFRACISCNTIETAKVCVTRKLFQ